MALPSPEPYTLEWHERRMDAHLGELAETVQGWMNRDRESWRDSSRWAGRLELVMRNVSAEAAAIKSINARERWWGVRAIR
jgi:hypothetical protein